MLSVNIFSVDSWGTGENVTQGHIFMPLYVSVYDASSYQTCRQASMAKKMPHKRAKGTANSKVRQRYVQIRALSKPTTL